MKELSVNQMEQISGGDVMDAICYAAGVGASFWPIGTLIAGPTVIGCVVYYGVSG